MPQKKFDPYDLDTLVSTWDRFGSRIWTDDRTLVFDYLAFLFARDRLERVILAADPETASTIRARVAAADDRFRADTNDADPGLVARYKKPDSGWWWRRTPKELGHALRPELA
jgi:hypothetical protein